MLSSPPKRRKISGTTSIDASQTEQQPFNRGGRAGSHDLPSFQSPTKASLARSSRDSLLHENRSPTRSPWRPGNSNQDGQQARDEGQVPGLRDRKALRRSLGSVSPMSAFRFSPRKSPGKIQAFAVPPRRVSRRIMPPDLAFGSPTAMRNKVPEPTRTGTPELPGFDGAADVGDPKMDFFPSNEALGEPDLPPTPTQLGMMRPQGRAKGLTSSSPSARQATRARRRSVDTLKPRALDVKRVRDGGKQGDLSEGLSLGQPLFPEAVLKKQKLKKALSAEMQKLKDEIEELRSLTEKLHDTDTKPEPTTEDFNKLISLLTSEGSAAASQTPRPTNMPMSSLLSTLLPFSKNTRRTIRQTSPHPTNPFALQEPAESGPYLTAFAPLALTTHSNRVSASESGPLRENHSLTFTAPSPFPPGVYGISVSYESDPETQSLTAVSIPDREDPTSNIPGDLRRWIDSRLANPLLKLDVSSLCWGINRYWEAALSRAQIWTKLERQHPNLVAGSISSNHKPVGREWDSKALTRSDLGHLVSHLERSAMLFESTERAIKVLLSCTLAIDEWTSEPLLTGEISVSTAPPNRKIEEESKKLFLALMGENKPRPGSDGNGVVRAMEGVLRSLFRGVS